MILDIITVIVFGFSLWKTFVFIGETSVGTADNLDTNQVSFDIVFLAIFWTIWYALITFNT